MSAIRDELDFAWMGRVATEDGAAVWRPGHLREPVLRLDETDFSGPATLQSGGFENAITAGVRLTMAQSQFDEDRLATSAAPALTFGQEDLPGEVVDIGERAFVTDPFLAARNCEYTRRILRETRRAIIPIRVSRKLRLRALRVGDPVSLHAPDINARGETWVVVGRDVQPDKSMRLVLQPDIDWSEPSVLPPLRSAASTGTASPNTGEPTDPTEPSAPTEPSSETPPTEQ